MNSIDNVTKEYLKVLKVNPDQNWVKDIRNKLIQNRASSKVIENVTNSELSRIPKQVYNFLKDVLMGKQAKIALSVFLALTVFVGSSIFIATTADAATPGDFLYGIDRSLEDVQRAITFSSEAQADLEVDLLEERSQELSEIIENDADIELIEEAVDDLEEQEENVKARIRDAEDNENSDSGELERIRERLELQQKQNLQLMEQLQEKYQTKGEDATKEQSGKTNEEGGSKGLENKVNDYQGKLDEEVGKGSGSGSESNETGGNTNGGQNNPGNTGK